MHVERREPSRALAFPRHRWRVGCGFEQLDLRPWRAPALNAAFLGSSGLLLLVLIRNGPFGGMACIPSITELRLFFAQVFKKREETPPSIWGMRSQCATEAPVNPPRPVSAARWWLRHQPPRSGATQKRGAHQPPENAPQCIRTREGVAYYSSPLTKKCAFACQAFWSEGKNSTTREGSRRVHKVHPTDFPVHSVQGPLRGGWFS
jgi:hypothetical protein